jgi:transposase-like protein
VAELIRQVGISEQTFYRWKKKYRGRKRTVEITATCMTPDSQLRRS